MFYRQYNIMSFWKTLVSFSTNLDNSCMILYIFTLWCIYRDQSVYIDIFGEVSLSFCFYYMLKLLAITLCHKFYVRTMNAIFCICQYQKLAEFTNYFVRDKYTSRTLLLYATKCTFMYLSSFCRKLFSYTQYLPTYKIRF